MTTLWVLLHVAAHRDYELHSLDFSTAFLQGSLHEEIWLRRPPGITGSFPSGTQWSLRRLVYGLRQAPREWHDTLRTTLAALGFAPSTAAPSLFLRTDTLLPPFYILVYVDDLVFATADTAGLAHMKSELQKRHTCTDQGVLRSYLGLQITRDRAHRTITLTQSHMVQQVLQRFDFTYSSPQATPLSTRHSLSALPSDESVEPSGLYPELVGCLMYLMTCTRPDLAYPLSILARYVAPGRHRPEHMVAAKRTRLFRGGPWVDVLATQRSSQGYTFSLGSGSVSWRSTRSSSILSSSCEAEIYAGAMAAQELRWLTYLLTDLGEPPRSLPVLYQRGQLRLAYVASKANSADIFTKALQPSDHQRFCTMLGLCDSKHSLSLFDLTSGASTAPTADADSTVHSQWLTRDAAARLAVRNHLPSTERAHFSQYKSARALYDAVDARYSSPTTIALSHIMLPYHFPDLAAFATVADLVAHLRTSDARYRAALPTEIPPTNSSPMYITLYYLVTRLPDSLSSVRDQFLSLCPTELTVDLLEEHLAAAPTCVPCVEGRQRAAPHSSLFPPTKAPLQTLLMDVWGPARVRGQGHELYFLLVFDDYSRYTTVFPLRSKGEATEVLIDWIRGARRQLGESFGSDLPVQRLHSHRGGEFSSDLLRAFCRSEGICQTFTLRASPQQNGIAEGSIGMVMDVAHTSMIHAATPHFLWPFVVQYAAHQINLQPRVSLPETTPTIRWTGKVGDASAFRVWGSRAIVRDTTADKLSSHAVPCVFLGFPPDTPGWQFYHPTSRRVLSSQDVTFDESVSYYHLFPYRTASPPPSAALPRTSASQSVPLPSPPASSLLNSLRAASPTVTRFLATAATDPLFESSAASVLVAELLDFAAACRLDYATSFVAASASVCPPSVGGECALGTDGDPDAPDILTPRSYAEAIEGPCSSQWQAAMDAEMASRKSTGTYVDEVPPPGAKIVSGMRIFRVKRPPGSPPAFKARYLARGFSQRQGDDFFQTFSPTPKMNTLRVLLHVAAQRDYELHSLDFSTAFLQGSLHEEIWLRRPPGFSGSFPDGTQWSLRRPVYGLRQSPCEWHDTLRLTLAALGFAPSTADPLFLRTDANLPLFYVLVYVDDLVFATAGTEALAHVKSELQKRHTCTDLVILTGYADASWVDDLAMQRSSQGYTFRLGSGSVSWRSTRSSSVLSSSCEAEIYAGAMAVQELRWLTYLLTDLGEAPRSPPVLYVDNKAMLA
ncbi:unnamed protein product [Closterium sp. NIES-53]